MTDDPKERVIQLGNELLTVIYQSSVIQPQLAEYSEKMQPQNLAYLQAAEVAEALACMGEAVSLASRQMRLTEEYVELRKTLGW
jgi:hypothetical protein